MKTHISALMLERYRLGELSPEDRAAVDEALAVDDGLRRADGGLRRVDDGLRQADDGLRRRLNDLDESDRELRLRYPAESVGLAEHGGRRVRAHIHSMGGRSLGAHEHYSMRPRLSRAKKRLITVAVAAAVALAIVLPAFRFAVSKNSPGTAIAAAPHIEQGIALLPDRPKGRVPAGSELALYLKENQESVLPDQAVLQEGSTVQLAYTVPAEAEHYGVIFSIDGRRAVTMHYPYRKGQSSLLVSGRRTFLSEAYILDDAPDYEVFVMVVSEEPLDTDDILREAQQMAEADATIQTVVNKSKAAFEDCEVETVTILKNTKQR